jgi:hypothetical protein
LAAFAVAQTDKGRILGKYRLDVAAFRQQRQRLAAAANA